MIKRICFLILTVLMLMVTDVVYAAPQKKGGMPTESIAMFGFVNRIPPGTVSGDLTKSYTAAEVALIDALYAGGKIDVYDMTPETSKARADEIAVALELGIKNPVYKEFSNYDYVLCGYLTNLSVKTAVNNVNTLQGVALDSDSQTVIANLSVAIYDTKTGKRVFVATGKGESTAHRVAANYNGIMVNQGKEFVPEQSAFNAYNKAAAEVAKKINAAI